MIFFFIASAESIRNYMELKLVSQLIKIEANQEKHQLELHTHAFLVENVFRVQNFFRAEQKICTRSIFGLIKKINTEKIFTEGDECLTLCAESLQYTGTSGHVNLISSQSETHS